MVELKLRMLCETVPALSGFAHAERLEDAEKAIIAHFSADLSSADRKLLVLTRQLRNKILHCDFRAARAKLAESGATPGSGNVHFLGVDENVTVQQLADVLAKGINQLPTVASTESTREGTVFGWLMELGAAEDFGLAAETFRRAVGILDRLAQLNSDREVEAIRRADT